MEVVDLEKVHEKYLYPAVEKFLKTQKNCFAEYVGSELSLKRGKNKRTCSNFRRNTTKREWNAIKSFTDGR